MPTYFEHIELVSGIHHFIWLDNSNESAKAYQIFLAELLNDVPKDEITTLRILHDYRGVSFHPFLQVLGSTKSLSSLYPHIVARIAYIIRDLSFEILMKSMAQISQDRIKRQLFRLDEEPQAIEWLLCDDDESK